MVPVKRPDQACLERLRQVAGENVSSFARKLGMPTGMVHRYLSGRTVPSYEFFERLATTGYDVNWILSGRKSSPAKSQALPAHTESDVFKKAVSLAEDLVKLPPQASTQAETVCKAVIKALEAPIHPAGKRKR